MIYKSHSIELVINGNRAELESQKSLNLRFQNVLFNPEKINSSQAEYSFEFELPSTPTNDKIFDYANNLSKMNKFVSRYNAEVYADATKIFEGTLTLNSFKDKKYSCNLVSVKIYSFEDIFEDSVMTDLDNWKIDFNGVETINEYNLKSNPDVFFPLVSYGAFQKTPKLSDEVGNEYTSKYDLDEYNQWYVESFSPSLNMLETIKHLFNYKGYTVGGDALRDNFLRQVYLSTNLSDEQSPDYNIGNPRFGKVDVNIHLDTDQQYKYEQELNFPYFKVYNRGNEPDASTEETEYNLPSVDIYSCLKNGTVTVNNTPNYMYQPNEGIIVIPADGWYKISLSADTTITTSGSLTVGQNIVDMVAREMEFQNITITPDIKESTPIEIQLVRNYDDNVELIKGKNNRKYINGNPNDEYYWISEEHIPETRRDNIVNWLTCFPHEDPYASELPTKENDLKTRNKQSRYGGLRTSEQSAAESTTTSSGNNDVSGGGHFNGWRGGTRGDIDRTTERRYSPLDYGYVYNDGEEMVYDQAVSEGFICGLSSLSSGTPAVMKNGYSWSPLNAHKNEIFAPVIGYSMASREAGTGNLIFEETTHNQNSYINTPVPKCTITGNNMKGLVTCMVYLNKNDILELFAIHRAYRTDNGNEVNYSSSTDIQMTIEAFSNRTQNELKASHDNRYEAPVEFDDKLNLAHFMNKETKMSDFVQGIINAYNLEFVQYGNLVEFNRKKKFNYGASVVELDDRANTANAEASKINYPKSMAVKYKIDTDEHGFYDSVPADKIELADWKKYGDSGYSVVILNDDSYVTTTSDVNLNFSYCWYDDFNWFNVNSGFTRQSDTPVSLKLPVISKEEYMIDGYDYTESLKHDGYGLTQRFWIKTQPTSQFVWTKTYPVERVTLCIPRNYITDYRSIYLELSYKDKKDTLLREYFNFVPYLASNYVEIEAYLSPDEYNMIKNGALIHFDSDIYYPVEVNGYDPSGYNATEIKMMKKL